MTMTTTAKMTLLEVGNYTKLSIIGLWGYNPSPNFEGGTRQKQV